MQTRGERKLHIWRVRIRRWYLAKENSGHGFQIVVVRFIELKVL